MLIGQLEKVPRGCQSSRSHSGSIQGFCRRLIRRNLTCLCRLNHNYKICLIEVVTNQAWLLTLSVPVFSPGRHLKIFSAKQRWTFWAPSVLHSYSHIVKQFRCGWAQLFWADFIVPHCWVGISTLASCQESANASCKWKVLQTIINVSRHINRDVKRKKFLNSSNVVFLPHC